MGVMLISRFFGFFQKTGASYFFPCISISYQLSLVDLASLLIEDLERYVLVKKIIVNELLNEVVAALAELMLMS